MTMWHLLLHIPGSTFKSCFCFLIATNLNNQRMFLSHLPQLYVLFHEFYWGHTAFFRMIWTITAAAIFFIGLTFYISMNYFTLFIINWNDLLKFFPIICSSCSDWYYSVGHLALVLYLCLLCLTLPWPGTVRNKCCRCLICCLESLSSLQMTSAFSNIKFSSFNNLSCTFPLFVPPTILYLINYSVNSPHLRVFAIIHNTGQCFYYFCLPLALTFTQIRISKIHFRGVYILLYYIVTFLTWRVFCFVWRSMLSKH